MKLTRQHFSRLLSTIVLFHLSACASHQTSITESEGLPRNTLGTVRVEFGCESIYWNDIVLLVAPYQDENLQVALVQQGLSNNYKTAIAAKIVLEDGAQLPKMVRRILESIVHADC